LTQIIIKSISAQSKGCIEFSREPSSELLLAFYKLGFRGCVRWPSDSDEMTIGTDIEKFLTTEIA